MSEQFSTKYPTKSSDEEFDIGNEGVPLPEFHERQNHYTWSHRLYCRL